jgi:RND family efflux transporter MFP subunit
MKKLIVLLVFLCVVGLVGYRAYEAYQTKSQGSDPGQNRANPSKGGGTSAAAMRVPLVDVVSAQEGLLEDEVLLIGSLRPFAEVQVMSKIAGRVEQVLVDVGDTVHQGQLIAQVEDREIQQQILQAEASLGVARAVIRQREAELTNLERQVARYRDLFDQHLVSRQDLEDLATRQQSALAQLELGKAQLRQGEASLAQYRINLENTRSHSPLDGFVGRRFIHPGALVTANTPIVTLVELRTMRMIVNAVERDIVRVQRGTQVELSVDAFPGRRFMGRIVRVSPVLDAATRTGEVEIQVSNPALDLRAEMFARVSLKLGGQRKGILVPREAVVYRGEQSGVFVLNGDKVVFRPVQAGITQQNVVEIVDGLKLDERIVSMGASLLKDGDQVRLKGEDLRPESRVRETLLPPPSRIQAGAEA